MRAIRCDLPSSADIGGHQLRSRCWQPERAMLPLPPVHIDPPPPPPPHQKKGAGGGGGGGGFRFFFFIVVFHSLGTFECGVMVSCVVLARNHDEAVVTGPLE